MAKYIIHSILCFQSEGKTSASVYIDTYSQEALQVLHSFLSVLHTALT